MNKNIYSKNKLPLVSIYVISKNYGKYLEKAIESVFEQTYKNWELFLVDDNSTDNTSQIFKKIKNFNLNKIVKIRNRSTLGIQKIANKVLLIGSGKYIIRVDADDWLEKNAIKEMVKVLELNKKFEIVFGNYNFVSEEGYKLGSDKKISFKNRINFKHFPAHGACTMFRRNTLVKIGGYNEKLNAQDGWDIWQKIAKKKNIFQIKKILFNYRQHENSLSFNKDQILKNRNIIFKSLLQKKEKKLNCLAVIPVKENFKNFYNVPFLKLKNKYLINITLQEALNSKLIDKIAITTASKKVLSYVSKIKKLRNNKKIFTIERKEESTRFANIRNLILQACNEYKKKYKKKLDLIIYLSIHSPFRTSKHIEKAINVLRVNKCETIFSVNIEYDPIFKFSKKGFNLLNPGRFDELNFEKETLLKFNGSIILTKYSTIKNKNIFKSDIGYYEMNNYDSQQIKSLDEYTKVKNLLK